MEDKTQDVNSLEDLLKAADEFRKWAVDFGDRLAKVLADIQTSKKEEDTWEMKCPYKDGDKYYFLQSSGDVFLGRWDNIEADNRYFSQGNIFLTEQEAELEAKRRNLLTRFRAFRNECNGDWKPDMTDVTNKKYYLSYSQTKIGIYASYIVLGNHFHIFGYFKNRDDAERAIELFRDEIIELYVDNEV